MTPGWREPTHLGQSRRRRAFFVWTGGGFAFHRPNNVATAKSPCRVAWCPSMPPCASSCVPTTPPCRSLGHLARSPGLRCSVHPEGVALTIGRLPFSAPSARCSLCCWVLGRLAVAPGRRVRLLAARSGPAGTSGATLPARSARGAADGGRVVRSVGAHLRAASLLLCVALAGWRSPSRRVRLLGAGSGPAGASGASLPARCVPSTGDGGRVVRPVRAHLRAVVVVLLLRRLSVSAH